jgi:hypothetical protein
MRDGAPIRWDRDSDFGFLERDLPHFLVAMRKLRAAEYQAVKYDFFLFDRNGANIRWYFHWRDCRAIVERYPWTGERRPPD